MKHPKTNEQLFDSDEIKKAALDYCTDLLKNRQPKDEYSRDVYITNLLHIVRMDDMDIKEDDDILTVDLFDSILLDLKKKKSEKYKFILKSGQGCKNALFNIFKAVWKQVKKPQQWRNSTILQLYKGSGPKDEFNNQRNIHIKHAVPKLFENIVLSLAKPKIVSGTTKYQIGAMPKHRAQEHLFTLKSIIALYNHFKIPLILQLFDISKFFDRESLRDGLNSIYLSGVQGNIYKLLYELNKDTQIKVNTLSGVSEISCTGENVTQGSLSAALISANNLDRGINDHFKGSSHEVSYNNIRMQPLIFQDDLLAD